jgi:hypothetical protein
MKTVGSNSFKKKDEVPVHTKKAYKGSRGIAPLILYLDTR